MCFLLPKILLFSNRPLSFNNHISKFYSQTKNSSKYRSKEDIMAEKINNITLNQGVSIRPHELKELTTLAMMTFELPLTEESLKDLETFFLFLGLFFRIFNKYSEKKKKKEVVR